MRTAEIFYGLKCDRCRQAYSDGDDHEYFSDGAEEHATDDEWIHRNGKYYCPNCYTIDEETDDEVIKEKIPSQVFDVLKLCTNHVFNSRGVFKEEENSFIIHGYLKGKTIDTLVVDMIRYIANPMSISVEVKEGKYSNNQVEISLLKTQQK